MTSHDPADQPEHVCAQMGEMQPYCNSYYCAMDRAAALNLERWSDEALLAVYGVFYSNTDLDNFDVTAKLDRIRGEIVRRMKTATQPQGEPK